MGIKQSIGWATRTWNPVTGCWGPGGTRDKPNRCFYCYARRMAKRLKGRFGYPEDDPFVPTFHPTRLSEPSEWKNPGRVFVCSMGDLFGDWIDPSWIDRILEEARHHPGHTFLFLTKNPGRYREFEFPENCWLGATAVDDHSSYYKAVELAGMNNITFLSYEPLMSPVYTKYRELRWINWVIIGAMTGPGAKQYTPKKDWVEKIVSEAKRLNIPVFMKDNLRPYWEGELVHEWPEAGFPHGSVTPLAV